jgi:hypothetical protein
MNFFFVIAQNILVCIQKFSNNVQKILIISLGDIIVLVARQVIENF